MFHKVVIVIRDSDNTENINGLTFTATGWNFLSKKYKEKIIEYLQKRMKE